MRKIFQSTVLLLALLATTLSPGKFTSAIDATWAQDDDLLFIPLWIDPSPGFLDGRFNANARFDLSAKLLCVFTYDEEQISQKQVETEIKDFQTADWVVGRLCYNFAPEHFQSIGLSATTEHGLLNNRSGVFYYAINLERWGAEGAEWIWGKIDHHECSYNDDTDPHTAGACSWGGDVDTGKFLLLRSGEEPTEYISWAEEWQEDLVGRVRGFEAEIEAWDGNKAEQEDIIKRIKHTKKLTVDANEAATLDVQYQELLDKFEQKIAALKPVEPEKPPIVAPEVPVAPAVPEDNPKEEINPQPVKPSHSSNKGESANDSAASESVDRIDAETSSGSDDSTQQSSADKIADESNIATEIEQQGLSSKQNYNSPDDNREAEDGASNTKNTTSDDNAEVDIPILRAGEIKGNNSWLFWLIIPIMLLVGTAGWWLKRAFLKKRH